MNTPIFKFASTRAVFADLSDVEWTPRRSVVADDSVLLVWHQKGYVERRPVKKGRYNTYEYRRAIPVPPLPVKVQKRAAKKPVRLPEVLSPTWEPRRETKPATRAQLDAWHHACERIGSLPALIGQCCQGAA